VNPLGSPRLRVGILAIGRLRPGFDPQWGREIAAAAWQTCQQLFDARRSKVDVVDDGSLRQALREFQAAECDALVVLQPTMGDGRLAPILIQLWDGPMVFWATPERPQADRVTACSLVGTHVFASICRQMNCPFELVYGHPEDEALQLGLRDAVLVTRAVTRIRRAKIGLIGYHAPGFINMHADPMAVHRQFGAELHHVGLHEFQQRFEAVEDHRVEQDVTEVLRFKLPRSSEIADSDLVPNSRYYLALLDLLDQEQLDAVALRCWPELPTLLGHWPYLALMRCAEAGHSISLEGDVDGAILGLLGTWLELGPGYVSDWLAHDEQSITLWHPGHAPRALCRSESIRLDRHFNNQKPLVVNATLRPDETLTIARLWRCDQRYLLTAFSGQTEVPDQTLLGACGKIRVQPPSVPERFERLCHAGMPHHVTLFQGDQVTMLQRLANRLDIEWLPA
jgi:L-fucose isomerase-like protein